MRGPLRQLGEPQRQVGGILGAKYETGLRLKGASFRVKWVKPDLVGTIWSWIRRFWHCNGPNGSWYTNFDIEMSQLEAWLSLIWGWVGQLEATPTQVNAKMGYLEANIRIYLMCASSLLIWASLPNWASSWPIWATSWPIWASKWPVWASSWPVGASSWHT